MSFNILFSQFPFSAFPAVISTFYFLLSPFVSVTVLLRTGAP